LNRERVHRFYEKQGKAGSDKLCQERGYWAVDTTVEKAGRKQNGTCAAKKL